MARRRLTARSRKQFGEISGLRVELTRPEERAPPDLRSQTRHVEYENRSAPHPMSTAPAKRRLRQEHDTVPASGRAQSELTPQERPLHAPRPRQSLLRLQVEREMVHVYR